ncbi:hypothetical protein [Turicibacter sanguinis]|nr:hypothetical protein [Turicibacter sanguinis]
MLKKNTKVKHIKHGEGLVVGNSGRDSKMFGYHQNKGRNYSSASKANRN